MPTRTHIRLAAALALAAAVALVVASAGSAAKPSGRTPLDLDGDASSGLVTKAPNDAVQAGFTSLSYAPGSTAVLRLRGTAPLLTLQFFHAGAAARGPLQGAPVSAPQTLRRPSGEIKLLLGSWPSGLYYASLTTPGRGVWYAPFILRPTHLGANTVLVVLPTNTWQAYNFEDDDSWYENASVHTVDLTRPFIDGGVPPHYHGYDRGFIRWLAVNHKHADFLSDDDLDRLAVGPALAHAYDLVVFSGHEEYVSAHEYDVIEHYRDLGGNLAFLSANNMFYKVVKHGREMDGRWRWRDLGRPEAAVIGAEYVDWNHNEYRNRPYVVTDAQAAPWLYAGTGLRNGSTFGVYGIEVDARTAQSPKGTKILAQISGIFGHGKNAEMTYYTTSRGARVFSAGVMNFGGSSLWPVVTTMMQNIWAELSKP